MPAKRNSSQHDAASLMARQLSDEPMARHTSWRVGGPAQVFFRPANQNELATYVRALPADLPVHFVGLGSNLLVRDGGIRGAVIAVQEALGGSQVLGAGRMHAGAGLACTVFARQCVRLQLGPAEFFAGIPGTIGGALKMNAGAFGGETWDRIESVDVMNRQGEIATRTPDEYDVSYRHTALRCGPVEEWFTSAVFRFDTDYDTSMEKLRTLVNQRKQTQPLGLPSCGSVFRNPPGDHAARLIEAAGLKGYAIGGAVVSDKHANFIINTGTATAADIEALIEHVQAEVKARHGVELHREVQILGEPGSELGGAPQ